MIDPTNGKGVEPLDTRVEGKEVLLSEAFEAYREIIIYKNQSAKTEENHLVCLKALIDYFGDIPIESLTFPMIREWKQHLSKDKADCTVRNYIIKLRVVLDYLFKQGEKVIDPDTVPVPKRSDTVPVFIDRKQVRTLIESTSSIRAKAILSLLYSSGVRVSELCAINKQDIQDCQFTVVGKGGRARLCFIDSRTCRLLNQYLKTRTDNLPPLFLSNNNKRLTPSNVQEIFRHLRKKTGIEAHCYTMRHSFATNLLKTNTNLYYVSKFLGHKSLDTTKTYLHCVDEDLHRIYKRHHSV